VGCQGLRPPPGLYPCSGHFLPLPFGPALLIIYVSLSLLCDPFYPGMCSSSPHSLSWAWAPLPPPLAPVRFFRKSEYVPIFVLLPTCLLFALHVFIPCWSGQPLSPYCPAPSPLFLYSSLSVVFFKPFSFGPPFYTFSLGFSARFFFAAFFISFWFRHQQRHAFQTHTLPPLDIQNDCVLNFKIG